MYRSKSTIRFLSAGCLSLAIHAWLLALKLENRQPDQQPPIKAVVVDLITNLGKKPVTGEEPALVSVELTPKPLTSVRFNTPNSQARRKKIKTAAIKPPQKNQPERINPAEIQNLPNPEGQDHRSITEETDATVVQAAQLSGDREVIKEASDGSSVSNQAAPAIQAVPMYLENPKPRYPPLARRWGFEGTVLLDVFVDKIGSVTKLKISSSSGYSILDDSAVGTVRSWRFIPGKKGKAPMAMWVRVPVHFALR